MCWLNTINFDVAKNTCTAIYKNKITYDFPTSSKVNILHSILYSIGYIGVAFGCFLNYFTSKQFTKSKTLIFVSFTQSIFYIIGYFSKSWYSIPLMLTSKFVVTVGNGFWYSLVIPFLLETVPRKFETLRKWCSLSVSMGISFGIILASLLNFDFIFGNVDNWGYSILAGCILSGLNPVSYLYGCSLKDGKIMGSLKNHH